MKIVWVTPFNQRSAIGRVSVTVTEALSAKNHEVLIVRSEHNRADVAPAYVTSLPTVWWHDINPTDLELQNDVVVLNFGDNYQFHAGTMVFAEAFDCLGIFHDFYVYNFFNRCLVYNNLSEKRHQQEIRRIYGDDTLVLSALAWQDKAAAEQIAKCFPMTEWLGRRCGAALAHSNFYVRRLENSCPGPVAVAPLCFEGRDVALLPNRAHDHVTVSTIGIINPNKCVDTLIKAIGSSPALLEKCRYRLVGAITDVETARLRALCKDVGFNNLEIIGEVSTSALVSELERADIISCLRRPVLEGASASAIEGMKSGRPIIVADAGFYSELPDDLVFKVPSSVDVASLTDVLQRLVSNEPLRRETGEKARDWARTRFTSENYLSVLESLMSKFIDARPLLAVGKRLGRQMAELGLHSDDPEIQPLAARMSSLFCANGYKK